MAETEVKRPSCLKVLEASLFGNDAGGFLGDGGEGIAEGAFDGVLDLLSCEVSQRQRNKAIIAVMKSA